MSDPFRHRPVLLAETVELLAPAVGAVIVDGTVGGGGHAAALLERIGPAGRLLGLDVDDEALAAAAGRLGDDPRVRLVRASFRELARVLDELGVARVDGVVLDLGVSSRHLDEPERGFRFSEDTSHMTPLDMRMDRRNPHTAADLLASAPGPEIERWLREYGELPGAPRLARAIVETRRLRPLRTAQDLLRLVRETRVGGGRRHHPATLVFQALRIAVNDELRALAEGIEAAFDRLRPGGRLAVLSYHSLEDRIVKNRLRDAEKGCICPPRTPVCTCGRKPRARVLTRRPITASEAECRENPRARSARLRAAERIGEDA